MPHPNNSAHDKDEMERLVAWTLIRFGEGCAEHELCEFHAGLHLLNTLVGGMHTTMKICRNTRHEKSAHIMADEMIEQLQNHLMTLQNEREKT